MASVYTDAHRNACAAAIAALGNRIGLYYGSTRVGTVFADTTWGAAAKITEPVDATQPFHATTNPNVDKARVNGTAVTLTIPPGTVPNNTTINRYGIHNGTTLLRTMDLPVSLIVNDGGQQVQVDVTPVFKYRGE